MNNDNHLNFHLHDQMSGWLRYCLEIVCNNTVLNFVTKYLYLGNILDNHLTLAKNFNRSFKRASNHLRLLQYVRRNLAEKSAELIYKSMILPILTYSSTIKTTINDS